ncbi:hypothetical protein O6H91_19G008300 [Diphasiastrum complanatum]|uniref:Uncharacterized protein n=4 Tax=Diphasiastrum complanatum TaxID=34168 RepID=A0ACC2ASL0_DIPCM|nr:hypothetical protein O6H91_19G008300 [Diphasiastrum complanatum]
MSSVSATPIAPLNHFSFPRSCSLQARKYSTLLSKAAFRRQCHMATPYTASSSLRRFSERYVRFRLDREKCSERLPVNFWSKTSGYCLQPSQALASSMRSSFWSCEAIVLRKFQLQLSSVISSSIACCYSNYLETNDFNFHTMRQNGICLRSKSSVMKTRSFHTMDRSSSLCNISGSSFAVLNAGSSDKERQAGGEPKHISSKYARMSQGAEKPTSRSGQEDFENWSLEKIREAGPLAVPIVEELRKAFAPAAQPLTHYKVLQELDEWRSLSNVDINFCPTRAPISKKFIENDFSRETKQVTSLSPRSRSKKNKSSDKEGQNGSSHDSNDDGNDDDEDWHPMLRAFPTYHAKEEALYFHNLLAYPWEKGAFERYIAKLEEKFFPGDLLDFDKPSTSGRSRTEYMKNSRKEASAIRSATLIAGRLKNGEGNMATLNQITAYSSQLGSTHRPQLGSTDSSSGDRRMKGSQIARQSHEKVIKHLSQSSTPSYPTSEPACLNSQDSRAALSLINNSSNGEDGLTAIGASEEKVNCRLGGIMEEDKPDSNGETDHQKGFFSSKPSQSVEEQTKIFPTRSPARNSTFFAKPILLKSRDNLPMDWDGPGGTVVLIDKPKGWTSFAVCGQLRRLLGIQKVGHAGTLDPMATGLLVVCIGKATKLADSYQAMTKVYTGTFRLGEATSSYDADSQVCERLPWSHIQDVDIENVKESFVGDIMQVPPMYSAIKVGGERLYKKARRGEDIEVPPRMVSIYELEVDRSLENKQEVNFRVACSKGTYIRSLCADFGRALNRSYVSS